MREKTIIGLTEKITIYPKNKDPKILTAKIDTGASRSSIDVKLAEELGLGPVVMSKMIKSAHGTRLRPIVIAEIELDGKRLKEEFTIADRSHMKYGVLIGVNILKHDFLIDPKK